MPRSYKRMLLWVALTLVSLLNSVAAQDTWQCDLVEEALTNDGNPIAPPTYWWSSNGINYMHLQFATDGIYDLQSIARIQILGSREVETHAELCIGIFDSTTYTDEGEGGRKKVAWVTFHTEVTYPVAIIKVDISCWKQKRSISQCKPQLRAPLWFLQLPLYHYSPLSYAFWSNLTEDLFPSTTATKSWLHRINQQSNSGLSIQAKWLKLVKLPSLNSLELTGNDWSDSELELPSFPSLTELKLHANNITHLSDNFFQNLKNVITVILARNRLSKLPSSVTALKNLRLLDVTNPVLPKVPFSVEHISNIPELHVLGLENQMLVGSVMPIITLQNLAFLNLSGCGIRTFGSVDTIVNRRVTNLQVLDLSHNYLEEVPNELLRKFHKLDKLLLNNNSLHALGSSDHCPLTQLTNLDLSHNYIKALPTFQNASSLKSLILRSNGLRGFPDNFWDVMPELKFVDISQNQLKKIPEFRNNAKLETLDLSYNELVVAHRSEFESLEHITYLNISHNLLAVLDQHIFSDLPVLKVADISWNRLLNVKLTAARTESINLSHNVLTSFPEIHTPAFGVCYLDVSYNLISDIRVSNESLPDLQTLNLAWNKISKANFGNSAIGHVDISHNKLTELPLGASAVDSFKLGDNLLEKVPTKQSEDNHVLMWMNFMKWPLIVAAVIIIMIFLGIFMIVSKKLRKSRSPFLEISSYKSQSSSTVEYSQYM